MGGAHAGQVRKGRELQDKLGFECRSSREERGCSFCVTKKQHFAFLLIHSVSLVVCCLDF